MNRMIIMPEDEFINIMHSIVREELKGFQGATTTASDQPLTIDQAAAFINRPKASIYNLVSKRSIPHSKQGKRLYFDKEQLRAWVKSGAVKTTAEIINEADDILTGKANV